MREILSSPKREKKEEFPKPKSDLLLMSKMKRISEEDPDNINGGDTQNNIEDTAVENLSQLELDDFENAQSTEKRSDEDKKDLWIIQ